MGAQRNSPKPSPKKKSTTLQFLFDLDSREGSSGNTFSNLGRISSFDSENEEILSIISYCTVTYPLDDDHPSQSLRQDLKRLKLIQLLSIIKTFKKPLHDEILHPLFSMLASNLFRPLPPPCNASIISISPDDDDLIATPTAAWHHLQMVYDILLRLIITGDPKALRDFIDHPFLLNLLALFESEDSRERESLKNVYHRIYSKFTFYRAFMRKAMNDAFLHYIFETERRHSGIGELLEIWGSIINGFTVPLKEEHKLFLMRVLVPLHKPKNMQVYHRQLAYCVSQFVQKEPVLGGVVVRGILKYWPVTNCQKEVLFIGELEEIVENIDPEQYRKLALPLCTQITKCLNSWNSQVAERALYVWNNEQFVKVASQAMEEVFPVLVEGMEKNLKCHWSKSVRQLTENVKIMLEELEPTLYSECLQRLELYELAARREEMRRREKWEKIEMVAAKNQFCSHQQLVSFSLKETVTPHIHVPLTQYGV